MKSKPCIRCKESKAINEFYKHPQMGDGHLNKCIPCCVADARKHREENHAKVCAYDRKRFKSPERKKKILLYAKKRREKFPEKCRARGMVLDAIKSGKLIRKPCEVCGTTERVQAHHDDYTKPLEVRWMCFKHHREIGHGHKVETPDW